MVNFSNRVYENFSIVITTYNRKQSLIRCIESIYSQKYLGDIEVIVVDDCSPNSYEEEVIHLFKEIKFIKLTKNQGPGNARNIGINEAINNNVLIMDDDDVFTKDAFIKVNELINTEYYLNYPVVSFLVSNSLIEYKDKFYVFSFEEMIQNKIKGDTCQLINKKLWNEEKYEFPNSKIGEESLLWFEIAIEYGYPIVNEVIVNLMTDSEERLTNFNNQIEKANLFAKYQIKLINKFKTQLINTNNMPYLISKYKGAITYLCLAGNKTEALKYLNELFKLNFRSALTVSPIILINKKLLIQLFLKYRNKSQ